MGYGPITTTTQALVPGLSAATTSGQVALALVYWNAVLSGPAGTPFDSPDWPQDSAADATAAINLLNQYQAFLGDPSTHNPPPM